MDEAAEGAVSKQEMTDLSFQLLVEFSFSALRALIDAAGSERAIALNRPYWHHAGNAAGIILKQSMGLKAQNQNAAGEMYAFVAHVMRAEAEYIGIEGTDWQEIHVHSCPFETAPPEFCVLLDKIVADGMIESFEMNHEVMIDQMRTQGAPYCILRIIPKGSEQERPAGEEVSLPPYPVPPLSREEADSWAVQYIAEHWVMLTRAMMDFERSEVVLMSQLMSMREKGMSLGLRLLRSSPQRAEGLREVTSFLEFSNRLFHQEGTIVFEDLDKLEREITSCPFQNAPPAICAQYEAFLSGICEAVEPELRVSYEKMMTKGDRTCRWVVQRKSKSDRTSMVEAGTTPPVDEAIRALAMRLAKGEISEEEFERKRRLLKGP